MIDEPFTWRYFNKRFAQSAARHHSKSMSCTLYVTHCPSFEDEPWCVTNNSNVGLGEEMVATYEGGKKIEKTTRRLTPTEVDSVSGQTEDVELAIRSLIGAFCRYVYQHGSIRSEARSAAKLIANLNDSPIEAVTSQRVAGQELDEALKQFHLMVEGKTE